MAFTATYNAVRNTALAYIYRATSGGTVFSANLATSTAFDLFDDTAVANDAIYFAASTRYSNFSDLKINVGTAMAGTDIVLIWEYTRYKTGTAPNNYDWVTIPNLIDNSAGFTLTGEQVIEFPFPPWFMDTTNINTVLTGWIRCRIVSLTAITEGGATQTATVKCGDGVINISGTTDAVPATWTEVYNWVVANKPHLQPQKYSNVFQFPHCSISIGSRLRSTKETVMIGNGHGACSLSMGYLHSGTLYGTYNAYDVSSYYLCCALGAARFYGSSVTGATKLYGGVLGHWLYDDGLIATMGYTYLAGGMQFGAIDAVQVQVMMGFSGYLAAAASLKNMMLNGEFTTTGFPTTTTALDRVSCFGGRMSIFTASNGTLYDLSLINTGSAPVGTNTNIGNQKIYFVNPVNQFPLQTSLLAASFVNRSSSASATAISKVLFYDDSAGTFTDYTTQAQSTTADDVPINGDVNDIIYFLAATVDSNYAPVLNFDLTNVSNDYVYQWQVYTSSGWENCDKVWDRTNNFTTNTEHIYIKNSISTGSDGTNKRNHASVTINGTAGYWFRLKIITKGTGTPTFSRVRSSAQLGISEWRYYQQYTADIKVIDETNTAIANATVVCKDKNGTTLFTTTTGVDGKITQQTVTQREWFLDPINYYTNYGQIGSIDSDPFQIYISKVGYETYFTKKNITNKIDDVITLKTATPLMINAETGKTYVKLDTSNLTNREIVLDGELII